MNKILVVGSGNTCRSPMAEGMLRRIAEGYSIPDIEVCSRGLRPCHGEPATAYAIEVMQEIGVDISGHKALQVLPEELLDADCIYAMTEQHKNVLIDALPELAGRITVMEIPDPFRLGLEQYRQCREALLRFFTEELTGEPTDGTDT